MERDVPVVGQIFAGVNVPGAGHVLAKAIQMIIANDHQAFMTCEIGPVEAGSDIIMLVGWWFKHHQLLNPHN